MIHGREDTKNRTKRLSNFNQGSTEPNVACHEALFLNFLELDKLSGKLPPESQIATPISSVINIFTQYCPTASNPDAAYRHHILRQLHEAKHPNGQETNPTMTSAIPSPIAATLKIATAPKS
jgi:hypothetical protein